MMVIIVLRESGHFGDGMEMAMFAETIERVGVLSVYERQCRIDFTN